MWQHGFQHEFLAPKTHQHNEIVVGNNIVIQEIGKVMLTNKNLARHFLDEAVNTACYMLYHYFLRPYSFWFPYELF